MLLVGDEIALVSVDGVWKLHDSVARARLGGIAVDVLTVAVLVPVAGSDSNGVVRVRAVVRMDEHMVRAGGRAWVVPGQPLIVSGLRGVAQQVETAGFSYPGHVIVDGVAGMLDLVQVDVRCAAARTGDFNGEAQPGVGWHLKGVDVHVGRAEFQVFEGGVSSVQFEHAGVIEAVIEAAGAVVND